MKVYKIWIHIEEIDEEEGTYKDLDHLTQSYEEYDDLEDAKKALRRLVS